MSIVVENQTNFSLPIVTLEAIATSLTQREIELIVCDNDTIQQINAEYRGIDRPTDVLSFPLEGDFDEFPLGSIVMSSDIIIQRAQELGHTAKEESLLLFIHALLHLLGFDHEVDNGEMRIEEERVIRAFDLPKSLIIRTENQ
ncbi:MAG: rRNA maturation RNase YbeY [Campylobacterota bacterium]|nr:rRNA maturation RNase YbeY [Campylobacterota bacterium]